MSITVKDKTFDVFINQKELAEAVNRIGKEINEDYAKKNPLLVVILNGAFMFASDLMKTLTINCAITFLKLSSYAGTQSTGKIRKLIGLNENIQDKDVIIIEDIIDTGFTINDTIESIQQYKPSSVRVASLLFKKEALQKPAQIDYVGFTIPNDFVVGYGLDYDGLGRNLPAIYKLIN